MANGNAEDVKKSDSILKKIDEMDSVATFPEKISLFVLMLVIIFACWGMIRKISEGNEAYEFCLSNKQAFMEYLKESKCDTSRDIHHCMLIFHTRSKMFIDMKGEKS